MKRPATMGGLVGVCVCGSVAQVNGISRYTGTRSFVPAPFTARAAAVSGRHLAGRVGGNASDGYAPRHFVYHPSDLGSGHWSSSPDAKLLAGSNGREIDPLDAAEWAHCVECAGVESLVRSSTVIGLHSPCAHDRRQ